MYEVRSDRLYADGVPAEFRLTPNVGGTLKPRFLVMHYTAGRSHESSVTFLTDPAAKASAHLVIGRAGRDRAAGTLQPRLLACREERVAGAERP